ncbi:MAG: hypothetical protein ACI9YL_001049, partial [Luteibaculaceae bacterium]
ACAHFAVFPIAHAQLSPKSTNSQLPGREKRSPNK